MKPRSLFRLFLLAAFLPAAAQAAKGKYAASPSNYEMVEAPTAYTLLHGCYDVLTRMVDDGGLFLRANIGFRSHFMFGFSVNATNVVGHGPVEAQEPRLALKVKLFDQGKFPLALALGWDDRGYGTTQGRLFTPGLQKGFYGVASREFPKAGFLQLHGGVNAVRLKDFDSDRDLGIFTGTSFAVARFLYFSMEADKLLTDFWQLNANFQFAFEEPIRIGMDFREMNRSEGYTRILRIQYLSFF